jgi:hypothetical protein
MYTGEVGIRQANPIAGVENGFIAAAVINMLPELAPGDALKFRATIVVVPAKMEPVDGKSNECAGRLRSGRSTDVKTRPGDVIKMNINQFPRC